MYPRIAYVTYRGGLADTDMSVAMQALREARLDPQIVAWDDVADWADFDLVVVRSTWDYSGRRPEFLKWARAVEEITQLANPAACLVKNTDKTYLRDFSARSIPTIPTVWFEPGDDVVQCAQTLTGTDWERFIVKPNIGDGVFAARPIGSPQDAAARAAGYAGQGMLALIQPYLPVVERSAELSVVVIGGAISHAVARVATADGGWDVSPTPIPEGVADTVRKVLAVAYEDDLLYARVDLIPGPDGWLVMELEATEPRLYLDIVPGAPARFARAVRALVSPSD